MAEIFFCADYVFQLLVLNAGVFLKADIPPLCGVCRQAAEWPPADTLLLAQPLIDIERAAGEKRTGPLLANLCFNQLV